MRTASWRACGPARPTLGCARGPAWAKTPRLGQTSLSGGRGRGSQGSKAEWSPRGGQMGSRLLMPPCPATQQPPASRGRGLPRSASGPLLAMDPHTRICTWVKPVSLGLPLLEAVLLGSEASPEVFFCDLIAAAVTFLPSPPASWSLLKFY